MTASSEIFASVDARLAPLVGGDVEAGGGYERMPSGDPDIFPALHAYDGGEEELESETGATRLRLMLTVEGYVEGFSGPAAHDALSQLHADAVAALCGDPNFDLGMPGKVEGIEISGGRRVDVAELASKKRLGFAQDFAIQFATVRGDPSQFA